MSAIREAQKPFSFYPPEQFSLVNQAASLLPEIEQKIKAESRGSPLKKEKEEMPEYNKNKPFSQVLQDFVRSVRGRPLTSFNEVYKPEEIEEINKEIEGEERSLKMSIEAGEGEPSDVEDQPEIDLKMIAEERRASSKPVNEIINPSAEVTYSERLNVYTQNAYEK